MRDAILNSSNYKWWVFLVIATGTFASVMEVGTAIIALPTIANALSTDLPTVQWVIVGYAVTISALLLPMGRLSDIVGRKQVYVSGFALFVFGSIVATTSPNVAILIGGKMIQGAGAAMTQGTGMAMLTSCFAHNERGRVLGAHMSVVGSGQILGPVLGGLLVTALGWRWVIFVGIPTGSVALILALFVLDKTKFELTDTNTRFDWAGASLSATSMVAFLLALTFGPRLGWSSPEVIFSGTLCLFLISFFIWWELKSENPMLELRLFKVRIFALGILAAFISFLGFHSARFLMPFYLQAVLGFSAREVGLIFLPNAMGMIIAGPISGRLSDKFGFRPFNVAGLMFTACGLFTLSRVTETSPVAIAMLGMFLGSTGMGTFQSPNSSSVFNAVDPGKHGIVSALLNLVRNAAQVSSIAVATAIVTGVMASMGQPPTLDVVSENGDQNAILAFVSGLRIAYFSLACLMLLGVAASFMKGSPKSSSE